MTEREIYKEFTNSSEKELDTKDNKKAHVRNDVMTTIIAAGVKNKRYKSN